MIFRYVCINIRRVSGLAVAGTLLSISYSVCAFSDTNVSSCGVITSPGTYTLEDDISRNDASGKSCLVLRDTTDVTLDCHGHAVEAFPPQGLPTPPALAITGLKNFVVRNCHFDGFDQIVTIKDSSYGVLEDNQFAHPDRNALIYVASDHVDHLTVRKNTFYAMWEQIHATDMILENNTLECPVDPSRDICWALIMSQLGGQRNIYRGNSIEGGIKTLPDGSKKGATDDGFLLEDESGSVVDHNVINDVFDMGIENLGQMKNVKIISNRIENMCEGGFGGWYYSNLIGNLFANNDIACDKMIFYYRTWGMRPAKYGIPADKALIFMNNIFSGNKLHPPPGTKRAAISLPIYEPWMSLKKNKVVATHEKILRTMGTPQFHPYYDGKETIPQKALLTNNVFRDNDFGQAGPLHFEDGSPNAVYNQDFIIDGGNNKCLMNSASKFQPINCK